MNPTGLGPAETDRLGALVLGLAAQCDVRVLEIDHDVDLIARICTETLVLDFGRRIAFGPTRAILDGPARSRPPIWGVDHA